MSATRTSVSHYVHCPEFEDWGADEITQCIEWAERTPWFDGDEEARLAEVDWLLDQWLLQAERPVNMALPQ